MAFEKHSIHFFLFGIPPSQSVIPIWRELSDSRQMHPTLIATDSDSEKYLTENQFPFLRWRTIMHEALNERDRSDGNPDNHQLEKLFEQFILHQPCKNLFVTKELFFAQWKQSEREMAAAAYFWRRYSVSMTVHLDDLRSLDQSVIWHARQGDRKSLVLQHGYHIPQKYDPRIRTGNVPIRLLSGEYDRDCCRTYGYDESQLRVVGQPRFDRLANIGPDKKECFRKIYGLESGKVSILLLSVGMEELCRRMYPPIADEVKKLGASYQLIVKRHPRDQWPEQKKLFSPNGIDCIWFHEEDVQELICACDVVVNFGSTATIESVLLDRPVIYIQNQCLDAIFHEDPVVITISDPNQLARAVRSAEHLKNENQYRNNRRQFIEKYNYQHDGQATARVLSEITNLIEK